MLATPVWILVVSAPAWASGDLVLEAPDTTLYAGDVPVRVSGLPGSSAGLYLEMEFFGPGGWSQPLREQVGSVAAGALEASLPASWLDQQAPGVVRWRLRACADETGTQCSEWRMFGRDLGSRPAAAGPPAARAAVADSRRPVAPEGQAGSAADPDAAVIAAPTPGGYSEDVPVVIQSPASGPASAFVMQLEYYDRASGSWVKAHEEQIEADADGSVTSALSLDALATLQADALRWRIRARPAGLADAWSAWVVFGINRIQ